MLLLQGSPDTFEIKRYLMKHSVMFPLSFFSLKSDICLMQEFDKLGRKVAVTSYLHICSSVFRDHEIKSLRQTSP